MFTISAQSIVVISAWLILGSSPVWGDSLRQETNNIKTGQYLTAKKLAEWVIKANPGLASLHAAAEAAAYRIDPAGSLDDPRLSYGTAPLTSGSDTGLDQKIDFSQKIPWPGTLAARESVARHEAVAADRDVDALKLRVIAQTKSAYAEWRFVDEALAIHHATHDLLNDLIATAETRYAVGKALKQDVLQAEVERTNLDNHKLRLIQLQTTIQARINALLNREPDTPLPKAAPIKLLAIPAPFETLRELALAQHPDLARLDAKILAANSQITLAKKAFFPDFQVGVGYNSLWNDTDKRFVIGASINIPLNRSKRKSELSRARAEERRVELSLVERRANLLADLAQARAEVMEAHESVELYDEKLVPLAKEYLEAAVADYQSGTGAFLNVIIAEQRELNTMLALARARADYVRRLAELERWTGSSLNASLQAHLGVEQ
jgi:cobalt-zinc-cadmium efflux system outer membrane protein